MMSDALGFWVSRLAALDTLPGQEAMFTDEKIAAVMTYTRANFGNSAPAVSPDVVKAARAKFASRKAPCTQAELDAWKEEPGVPAPSKS